MSAAITIALHEPVQIAADPVRAIVVRPPGSRVFEAMAAARSGRSFSEADLIRFAARLSGHSVATLRRLAPDDLYFVGRAVERHYRDAARRMAVRSEIASSNAGGPA
jgi:hypothetical protein